MRRRDCLPASHELPTSLFRYCFSDRAMDDEARRRIVNYLFELHGESTCRCYEPTEKYEEQAILAHSIPSGTVLARLDRNGHVAMKLLALRNDKTRSLALALGTAYKPPSNRPRCFFSTAHHSAIPPAPCHPPDLASYGFALSTGRSDWLGQRFARATAAHSVDHKPNRFAVCCCHGASPNGEPRTTERLNARVPLALPVLG